MSIQRKGKCIWFVKVIITTYKKFGDLNNRDWHLTVKDNTGPTLSLKALGK